MKDHMQKIIPRQVTPPPAQAVENDDISHVVCRKKGNVSYQYCAACTDFIPAVKGLDNDDILEGNDGIDPFTGNSYATCKYFGEIVRYDPFYAQIRREQERMGLL